MGAPEAINRPMWRPSELRKAVTEWASKGFAVIVHPDGTIHVKPPAAIGTSNPIDLVDFKR